MCKILDGFVQVKLSIHSVVGQRKNQQRTAELQARTGNRTTKVTEMLYPKGTFAPMHEAIKTAKNFIEARAVASTMEGFRLVPVGEVNAVRKAERDCKAELANGAQIIRAGWRAIILNCERTRGSDFDPGQYPADPPLEDWFDLKVSILPHPKAGALADTMEAKESALGVELKAAMQEEFDAHIVAMRDDLLGRVSAAIGDYGKKLVRLRSDVYQCSGRGGCNKQWEAQKGAVCPRCQRTGTLVKKEKKVYDSMIDRLRELAETLDVMLPPEVLGGRSTETIMAPLLVESDAIRDASEMKLRTMETQARTTLQSLAGLIAGTFKPGTDEEEHANAA